MKYAFAPKNDRRRGTVLVLVVAVLALLAVIGTVYIISARSEKASALSGSANVNLRWAQKSVMEEVVSILGDWMYDSKGTFGGLDTSGTNKFVARYYDSPEVGAIPANTTNANLFYQAFADASNTYAFMRSQPWLVKNLHFQGGTDYSFLTPLAYDPSAGSYSLPWSSLSTANCTLQVVNDQTTSDSSSDDPRTGTNDSSANLLAFSDGSGVRYRFGVRILDTSRAANLNFGATDDSAAIGDTQGAYLTSMRLAPASGPFSTSDPYFNSGDTPGNLHYRSTGVGRAGLATNNQNFDLASWQSVAMRFERPQDGPSGLYNLALFDLSDELELRSYGEFGTTYPARPGSAGAATVTLWPNTLSADSTRGIPGGTITGNFARRNYSAYTVSRDLRVYPDVAPGVILTVSPSDSVTAPPNAPTGTAQWPPMPARIAANPAGSPDLSPANQPSQRNQDLMFYTAMAAAQIGTLMQNATAGTVAPDNTCFTAEETCSFMANYCTARWNGMAKDSTITGVDAADAYYLPAGPSFVDSAGICIRTAIQNSDGTTFTGLGREFNVANLTAAYTYLGYAPQPYFSEIAVSALVDDTRKDLVTGNPLPPVTVLKPDGTPDVAVELYNPYPVALSLNGYHLKNGSGMDIDLTGKYVPKNGFLVIASSSHFADKVDTTQKNVKTWTTDKLKANPSGDTRYILYRPYYPRGSAAIIAAAQPPALAAIDQADYGNLVDPNTIDGNAKLPLLSAGAGTLPVDVTIYRQGGAWGPVGTSFGNRGADTELTLGKPNSLAHPGTGHPLPLPDRYTYPNNDNTRQGKPFGMGEFARIIRISNEIDSAGNPTGSNTICDHLTNLGLASPYDKMITDWQYDAQILFDFWSDPGNYGTCPPSEPTLATTHHDMRAVRLLEQIAMIDRVSDFSINLDNSSTFNDVGKLRIPGQINVNTASGYVLRAIPNMTDQMVVKILAYRGGFRGAGLGYGRFKPSDPNAPKFNGVVQSADYSGMPGLGIRSLAELVGVLADSSATTLEKRDLEWGSIYNLCTVRSDAFVVYGYLEAVKVNPRYNGSHNNASDWYDTSAAGTTDDPGNVAAKNLRVARLRWVSIVDRSFCNYSTGNANFQLPRVVGTRDLPR